MNVAVIGCGPSSLAAAWAARGLGAHVDIYGPAEKSRIRGAILLHVPIPGITVTHPEGYVRQIVVGGHIDDYGRKLYGDTYLDRSGDPFYKGFHTWSVQDTYDKLWSHFERDMKNQMVDRMLLDRLQSSYDLVVNTAPATEFCLDPQAHEFVSASVDLTWETKFPNQEDNTIYYNADPRVAWVRSSSIFGSIVTEWLDGKAPKGAHRIWKPIRTTCDCFPSVFRTGRYGAWDHKSWIETAYYGTRERMLGVD